jgi:hypothetical protein
MTQAEIDALKTEGINAEKARVEAWMVWGDTDIKKVQAGIESGRHISAKETQEFILARTDKATLEAIASKSNPGANIPKNEPTAQSEDEKELQTAEAELEAALGLKKGE